MQCLKPRRPAHCSDAANRFSTSPDESLLVRDLQTAVPEMRMNTLLGNKALNRRLVCLGFDQSTPPTATLQLTTLQF
jgi:hypothetical protein